MWSGKHVLSLCVGVPLAIIAVRGVVEVARRSKVRSHFPAIKARKLECLRLQLADADRWINEEPPSSSLLEACGVWSVEDMRGALAEKKVTAVGLLRAFLRRALAAHERCNCLATLMLEDAIAAATQADAILATQGKAAFVSFPLLGIPVSIKENIAYRGTDCTLGLYGNCEKPLTCDSAVVTLVKGAGGVIFAKTTVPALLMSFECRSALFGLTTNPYDSQRTTGGSSGGEGAMAALRGSVIGIGTDIGGSIRIPAMFCGVVGLKPTFLRISNRNNRPIRGDEAIPSVTGPMGRSVKDVVDLFKVLSPGQDTMVDGTTNNLAFSEERYTAALSKRTLRIGYYSQDGFIDTSPACARAVDIVVDALRQDGHVLLPFSPPKVNEAISVFYQLIGADGTRRLRRLLGDDEAFGVIQPLLSLMALPPLIRNLAISGVARKVCRVFGEILRKASHEKRMDEVGELLIQRNDVRHAFADAMHAEQLDVVIAPGFYIPAMICDSSTRHSFGMSCAAYFNVLDLPVVALPVTRVDRDQDAWTDEPSNGMSRGVKSMYDATAMHGLPIGVQIASPKFTEEIALAVALRIDACREKQRSRSRTNMKLN